MEREYEQKGITLVALVITIILLLILASITISQLIGNGLFDKAITSHNVTMKAQLKEEIQMFIDELEIKYMLNGNSLDKNIIKEEIKNNLENVEIDIIGDVMTGEYKNYEFSILENYEVIIGDKLSGEKPIVTHIVDTETLGVTQVTITINAYVSDGTIVEIRKPDGSIEENTNSITYTVNKSGKYTFIVKSSGGRKNNYIVEITNIRPSEPIIKAEGTYPIITPEGIKNPDGEVTIIYDENEKLLNTYSEDNGVTFKEYKGPFKPNSSVIIAKSEYRENNEIYAQSQKDVIPIDAIGPEAYDGEINTSFASGDYRYIDIDSRMIGKKIEFFINYYGSGIVVKAMNDKNEEINSVTLTSDGMYKILEETKRLYIYTYDGGFHRGRIAEINVVNEANIICKDEYPIIKNNEFFTDVQVEIDYFDTTVNKKYKIDDGEWKDYIEPIILKYGQTIYAKGYDIDGEETRKVTQYKNDLANDALPVKAYDDNNNTGIATNDWRYIKIDDSMIGKTLQFTIGSYKSSVSIKALDQNNEIINSISSGSNIDYVIPENTTRLSIFTYDDGFATAYIYEIDIK